MGLVDFRQAKNDETRSDAEVVRRSSRIQETEEAQGVTLELRELGGFILRLREQSISAAPGCERDGA